MTDALKKRWAESVLTAAWRVLRAAAAGHARASAALALRRQEVAASDVRKICLFVDIAHPDNPHVPGLGDLISKNLFLKLLRGTYPNARLYCVAGPRLLRRYGRFLLAHGYVDELVECPEASGATAGPWVRLVRSLRKERFDLCVIDPSSAGLRGVQAYLCGMEWRIGVPYDSAEAVFLNRRVQLEFGRADAFPDLLDSTRAFAQAAGVPGALNRRDFGTWFPYVQESVSQGASRWLVAVHVGGDPHWNRRWPLAHYCALCERLCRVEGVGVVLVGGADEQAEVRSVLAAVTKANPAADIRDASGGTLNQMATQLDRADLFVGNDSAPMHIAAALGKQVIVPSGPIAPDLWQRLYGAHVVRSDHACSQPSEFSFRRHALRQSSCAEFDCPYGYDPSDPSYPRCLSNIGVERIWSVFEQWLEERNEATAAPASSH